jgi:F1F0 ATPase subunit 2
MTFVTVIQILAWLAFGAALGAVYFLILGRSVAALADGNDPRRAAVLLIARFGLAAAGFALAAAQGAMALLTALAGVLLARTVAIRRARGR